MLTRRRIRSFRPAWPSTGAQAPDSHGRGRSFRVLIRLCREIPVRATRRRRPWSDSGRGRIGDTSPRGVDCRPDHRRGCCLSTPSPEILSGQNANIATKPRVSGYQKYILLPLSTQKAPLTAITILILKPFYFYAWIKYAMRSNTIEINTFYCRYKDYRSFMLDGAKTYRTRSRFLKRFIIPRLLVPSEVFYAFLH